MSPEPTGDDSPIIEIGRGIINSWFPQLSQAVDGENDVEDCSAEIADVLRVWFTEAEPD
jgi:hypothetical protein